MKRIIAIMLSFALMLSFVACGAKETESVNKEQTIEVYFLL